MASLPFDFDDFEDDEKSNVRQYIVDKLGKSSMSANVCVCISRDGTTQVIVLPSIASFVVNAITLVKTALNQSAITVLPETPGQIVHAQGQRKDNFKSLTKALKGQSPTHFWLFITIYTKTSFEVCGTENFPLYEADLLALVKNITITWFNRSTIDLSIERKSSRSVPSTLVGKRSSVSEEFDITADNSDLHSQFELLNKKSLIERRKKL